MSEEDNTTSEPQRPAWTEQQQIEAFEKARAAARKLRPDWSDDDQHDAALQGWERWKNESRGAGPWQYVKFAVGDAERERLRARGGGPNGKESEATAIPQSVSGEPTYEHDYTDTLDKLRETLPPEQGADFFFECAAGPPSKNRGAPVSLAVIPDLLDSTLQDIDQEEQLMQQLHELSWRCRIPEWSTILKALQDPEFVGAYKLQRRAREWLENVNQAPFTREQEANMLIDAVQHHNAERITHLLRCLPIYCRETTVVPAGDTWADTEKAATVAIVDKALIDTLGKAPESRAKAVLRALGAPETRVVSNLDSHLRRK